MGIIKILDASLANKIAAGEVVEKPLSVVKELVENSIDAGATAITVEIQRGGITYMRVTDNGCGIEKEYIKTAFLPHATSKIAKVEDLDKIGTLGFKLLIFLAVLPLIVAATITLTSNIAALSTTLFAIVSVISISLTELNELEYS